MKKYDNYKDSGIEWLGEIPEHWEVKPYKHLVICNSKALTEKTNPEMEINYIEIGDVNSFDGIKETSKYTFEKAPSRARRIVREGDVIISTVRTYLKAITSISSKFDGFIASTGFAVLTPKLIHSGFLGNIALCEGLIGEIISLSKGVSYPSITSQDLTNISIPFPSKNEQNAIAYYLDHKTTQIDTLIAKKEQFISLLQEERTAVINQAVTKGLDPNVPMKDSGIEWLGEIPEHWEVKRMKFIANLKSGNNIISEQITKNAEFPVYGGNGLRGYYSEYTNDGDFILIGRQGALCGNINYATGKFWASEHAIVCYLNDNVDWIWFGKLLEIMNLNQYNQSAAQPGLAVGLIKNLNIGVPNIDEQILIKNFIEIENLRIQILIDKSQQEIELLKEYKTALISEVVTGKVDVRDVVFN